MNVNKPRIRLFKGTKETYSLRLPDDLYEYYDTYAATAGRSVSEIIIDVLDEVAAEWGAKVIQRKKKIKKGA